MKISDRPGRFFAIFIFSPLLMICALTVKDYNIYTCLTLVILSIGLFFYELYWISFTSEETIYI